MAASGSAGREGLGSVSESTASEGTTGRDIVASASASVEVHDVEAAIDELTQAATAAGGYVESMNTGGYTPIDVPGDTAGVSSDVGRSVPSPTTAWITVRIPADRLTDTVDGLRDLGVVTSSDLSQYDVTTQTVDLRARVAALQTSVTRLTELLSQSASTADLIAAESALSERQAELDSLQQQLTSLEGQVAMSSLSVSLTEPTPAVKADPAGFGDGLAAGWNGLVATLNGIVIGLGFLLPWLVMLAIAGLVVGGVVRAVRARRSRRTPVEPPSE
ncbi:DUF4349 domain-containing protein [Microbacterium sp.]|uniref:DUF4349 domain-containing protein n=1 Tax=Microbacterium sp. TaxID=51671 RepID=UPI0039E3D91B